MPAAGDKNGSTPSLLEDASKLAQEALGGLQRMWSGLSSSISSSSQTDEDSESRFRNGDGSVPMPPAPDESPDSSSTSPQPRSTEAPVWSSRKNPFREVERESVMVIHFATYGTEPQEQQTAEMVLWDLGVKGYNVVSATLNGIEVEPPRKKPVGG